MNPLHVRPALGHVHRLRAGQLSPRRRFGCTGQVQEVNDQLAAKEPHYHGNGMPIARSKITAQGQISVPAEIRKKLGVGPGSILEWQDDGTQIVVRRAGRYTSEDIHRALVGVRTPAKRNLADLKNGIRDYIRKRHARG